MSITRNNTDPENMQQHKPENRTQNTKTNNKITNAGTKTIETAHHNNYDWKKNWTKNTSSRKNRNGKRMEKEKTTTKKEGKGSCSRSTRKMVSWWFTNTCYAAKLQIQAPALKRFRTKQLWWQPFWALSPKSLRWREGLGNLQTYRARAVIDWAPCLRTPDSYSNGQGLGQTIMFMFQFLSCMVRAFRELNSIFRKKIRPVLFYSQKAPK